MYSTPSYLRINSQGLRSELPRAHQRKKFQWSPVFTIGNELFIIRRTVDHHRDNISQKLDIHGSRTLLKFALENKDSLTK